MEIQWHEKIKAILSASSDLKPKLDIAKISGQSRFREDLGFDSLAMAAFFYELQDHYPNLDEADVPTWKTIADCAQTLQQKS